MVTISIGSGINSLQFVIVQIEIIMVVAVGTTPATIALILPQSAGRTKVVRKAVIGHTIQDKQTGMVGHTNQDKQTGMAVPLATIRVRVHHPALASNMCWIPKMAFQE